MSEMKKIIIEVSDEVYQQITEAMIGNNMTFAQLFSTGMYILYLKAKAPNYDISFTENGKIVETVQNILEKV